MFLYSSYTTLLLLNHFSFTAAASDSGDDFTNNLFSDLAPLLTLFGEQVAKQFLGQSMGWADNLIFAMAPLGIITAVVAAIRVGGPTWLRAIIGRAKESQGAAELELMSSTSASVCELWNGQAIVRVLGSPEIIELVYLEKNDKTEDQNPLDHLSADIYSFEESKFCPSETDPLYNQKQKRRWRTNSTENNDEYELLSTQPPVFDHMDLEDRVPNPCAPNISLNARGETASQGELWSVAILGVVIQSIVITYWGLITKYGPWLAHFRKGGQMAPVYAFPMSAIGTIAVVSGMLICSHVVEAATVEEKWKAKEDEKMSVRFAWLQKGQVVNDEHFDSYAIFSLKNKQTIMTSRVRKDLKGFQSLVLLGTAISITGFIAQFMGLRGMHWSATIAQLAATALMSTLRAIIRRHLTRVPVAKKVVKNFELDCMAREIVKCKRFSIPYGKIQYGNTGVGNYYNLAVTGPIDGPSPFEPLVIPEDTLGKRLIEVRGRLKTISGWGSSFSKEVSALCDAIERTMEFISDPTNQLTLIENQFESVPELSGGSPSLVQRDLDLAEFQWSLVVSVQGFDEDPEYFEKIEFNMKRRRPREAGEQWGKWKVNRSEVEAAYSLYMLDFHEQDMRSLYRGRNRRGHRQQEDPESQDRTLRILGFRGNDISLAYARCLYDWWIARETKCIEVKRTYSSTTDNDIPPFRVVGIMETPLEDSRSMLAVVSNTPLEKLCAQHLFSVFISSAEALISSMPGKMTVRRYNKQNIGSFGIMHSAVEKVAQILRETGLATLEDAYISIIPPLAGKLPSITEVQTDILQQIQSPATTEAVKTDMLFWFSYTSHVSARLCTRTRKDLTSYTLAADAYAKAAQACLSVLGENHLQTYTATAELSRAIKIVVFKAEACQFILPEKDLPELRSWCLGVIDTLGAFYNTMPHDVAASFSIATLKIMKLHRDVLGSWAANGDSSYYEENQHLMTESPSVVRWNMEQEALKKISADLEGNIMANYDRAEWSQALSSALSSGYDAVSEFLLEHTPDAIALAVSMDYGNTTSELYSYTGPSINLQSDKCFVGEFSMRSASHTFDVDSEDENGQTTLCRAVYFNHYHLVESLLETHGADINKEDKIRRSPIFTAAILGYNNIFQLLLERGANPSAHHENGNTCLHVIVSKDYLDILDILLDPSYNRVPIDPTNDFGETPLHFAARGGYLASISCLLRMGAFVDKRNNIGQTPLAYAAASGHLDVVLALKERGADLEAVDNDGESIIQIATNYRHPHIVAVLLERGTPPHWICVRVAANSGDDETVEMLLNYLLHVWPLIELSQRKFSKLFKSKEYAPFLQQPTKNSLLRIAIRRGASIDLAKFFLDMGANPFAPDINGNSALSLGVEQRNHDLMFLLVFNKPEINTNTNYLELPLRIAIEGGDERALDILLYAGATVSDDQLIALSTRFGHFSITGRLFELGLRLDNQAIMDLLKTSILEGSTAIFELFDAMGVPTRELATRGSSLHLAAELGKDNVVFALLSIGVKVDSYSYNHWTALQIAVKAGHLSTVKLLIDSGARVNLKNRYGWSASSLARARQFREIEEYIASANSNESTDSDGNSSENLEEEDTDPWNDIFELDTGPQLVGDQQAELDFQLAPAVDAFPAQSFELHTNTTYQAYNPGRPAVDENSQQEVEAYNYSQGSQAPEVVLQQSATPPATSSHEIPPQTQQSSSQQDTGLTVSDHGERRSRTF